MNYKKKGTKVLVKSHYMISPDNRMTHVEIFTGFSSISNSHDWYTSSSKHVITY
jgi:hypothetical protein